MQQLRFQLRTYQPGDIGVLVRRRLLLCSKGQSQAFLPRRARLWAQRSKSNIFLAEPQRIARICYPCPQAARYLQGGVVHAQNCRAVLRKLVVHRNRGRRRAAPRAAKDEAPVETVDKFIVLHRMMMRNARQKGVCFAFNGPVLAVPRPTCQREPAPEQVRGRNHQMIFSPGRSLALPHHSVVMFRMLPRSFFTP